MGSKEGQNGNSRKTSLFGNFKKKKTIKVEKSSFDHDTFEELSQSQQTAKLCSEEVPV